MKSLIIALLFSAVAFAQQPNAVNSTEKVAETCPVKIVKSEFWSDYGVKVKYQNASDKEITAVKFIDKFTDAVGDEVTPSNGLLGITTFHHDLLDDRKVKPGEEKTAKFQQRTPDMRVQLHVWTETVKFADNSMWHDDGSHFCGAAK